jgi:hypothetical protein
LLKQLSDYKLYKKDSSSCQLKVLPSITKFIFWPQVDKDGYLRPAEFAEAVANLYAEDSLKALVKELAPDCVTKANERVKGGYKP